MRQINYAAMATLEFPIVDRLGRKPIAKAVPAVPHGDSVHDVVVPKKKPIAEFFGVSNMRKPAEIIFSSVMSRRLLWHSLAAQLANVAHALPVTTA
jgi:hypothetical protein